MTIYSSRYRSMMMDEMNHGYSGEGLCVNEES